MSAMSSLKKGDPLPHSDHMLRYVGARLYDQKTKKLHGDAFLPRETEKEPSVNWLEHYAPPLDNQIRNVVKCRRLTYGKTAKLVRLNIGRTIETVTRETEARIQLSVIYDNLEAVPSLGFGEDPSHGLIRGFPERGVLNDVSASDLTTIGFKIRDLCVDKGAIFDAVDYVS